MQLKSGFVVRKLGSSFMAVPVGPRTREMNGLVALNETAVFLWEHLQQETSEEALAAALLEEYEVSQEDALQAVRQFTQELAEKGLLQDE